MAFDRTLMVLAAALGLTGVAAGTFGAHGLAGRVTPEMLEIFETGVRYHMLHAVALVGVAIVAGGAGGAGAGRATGVGRLLRVAGACMAAGSVVFAGSLYALVLTDQRWLGMITPIGGVGFLAGWCLLGLAAIRAGREETSSGAH